MTITHKQATTLAAFIAELRPDWDHAGIVAALGKARSRGTADVVAVAAIRAAATTTNRTPGVLAADGAHWRPPAAHERPANLPPPLCRRCSTPHHGDCTDDVDRGDPARRAELIAAAKDAARSIRPPRRYDTEAGQ